MASSNGAQRNKNTTLLFVVIRGKLYLYIIENFTYGIVTMALPKLDYPEEEKRDWTGDYLIVCPNPEGGGFYQMFSERAFLAENIVNFFKNYPDVNFHANGIVVYELRAINLNK